MATYAIGAVNGCYEALQQRLNEINFDKNSDKLWFTGDLVNNSADSLSVLRFIKSLGKQAVAVLGDQDLEFLSVVEGIKPGAKESDLEEILEAPDSKELLSWLRQRPFLYHDAGTGYTMVHAGIPAEWSFSQARTFAIEAETALAFGNSRVFLENYYNGKLAKRWHAKLRGWQRNQVISNALTRIHYYTEKGHMKYLESREDNAIPENCTPWYLKNARGTAGQKIIFSLSSTFEDANIPGLFPIGPIAEGNTGIIKLVSGAEKTSVAQLAG